MTNRKLLLSAIAIGVSFAVQANQQRNFDLSFEGFENDAVLVKKDKRTAMLGCLGTDDVGDERAQFEKKYAMQVKALEQKSSWLSLFITPSEPTKPNVTRPVRAGAFQRGEVVNVRTIDRDDNQPKTTGWLAFATLGFLGR